MGLPRSELLRKLVHVGVGGFAFLLRDLPWWGAIALAAAAFVHNWLVLPLYGGRKLWRDPEHAQGYPLGILLYPLAVLALVLVFPGESRWMAAAVWGLLAFGDGMASLVGQLVGGPRLPWNERKGWAGLLAFAFFGTLGAGVLAAWTLGLPLGAAVSSKLLAVVLPVAILAALVETMPTTLDDNLTVPLVGAVALALLAPAEWPRLLLDPDLPRRALLGLAVNGAIAAPAFLARSIDLPGAVSAVVIGASITATLGLPGLALMVAFFVIGSAVTKMGYRIKAARGIAQERGGARGWRNAWANGGVPALLALLAGVAPEGLRGLFVLAYAASVATAAADTCSSETGKAYGRRTFLITTFRPVPPGTEGAVSLEGTLGGLGGGFAIAAVGAAAGLYQWPAAAVVGVAGLLGSLAESVVGTVAERRGWLDNDQLNALNTAIGAGFAALFARALP
ncbi:MAG TPA: DUF92 domain-containing protein [Vicinamibacteria bacterium]|nr:DUF92 domain-containing protein [Vicinamibacteria bacterium]